MHILDILLAIGCTIVAVTALFFLYNILFVVSGTKTKKMHENAGTVSDVIFGKVHKSFDEPRTEMVSNGLSVKRNKSGIGLEISPNGTFSDHSVARAITK